MPTTRSERSTKAQAVALHRLAVLARLLRATGRPAEAVAAEHIAALLSREAPQLRALP